MRLMSAEQIRDRISTASTELDPNGLEIVIPQTSESTSDFTSSILDSYDGSDDEDSWMTGSKIDHDGSWSDDSDEERTEKQDTHNTQLVRIEQIGELGIGF